MNPKTGRTSGHHVLMFSHMTADGGSNESGAWVAPILHFVPKDVCRHCRHADWLRLNRVPKWVRLGCTKRQFKGFAREQLNRARGHNKSLWYGVLVRRARVEGNDE